MNLKTAKTVLMILGVLLAASLLGGILTKKELFFWRCPKCRKWMGGREDQCPFCGAKLK